MPLEAALLHPSHVRDCMHEEIDEETESINGPNSKARFWMIYAVSAHVNHWFHGKVLSAEQQLHI